MEDERLFHILDNFRILVRKKELQTYVLIESENSVITLDVEKWKKFKKWFPIVNTEFNLRFENFDG